MFPSRTDSKNKPKPLKKQTPLYSPGVATVTAAYWCEYSDTTLRSGFIICCQSATNTITAHWKAGLFFFLNARVDAEDPPLLLKDFSGGFGPLLMLDKIKEDGEVFFYTTVRQLKGNVSGGFIPLLHTPCLHCNAR